MFRVYNFTFVTELLTSGKQFSVTYQCKTLNRLAQYINKDLIFGDKSVRMERMGNESD